MVSIGEIAIVITDRAKSAAAVNELLSQYGDDIIARTGVPQKEKNLYIISVVLEAESADIDALTEKLSRLPDVKVKSIII